MSALRRRHIEQSHMVSSGKSVSISKRTAPQWQEPRQVCIGRAFKDGFLRVCGGG